MLLRQGDSVGGARGPPLYTHQIGGNQDAPLVSSVAMSTQTSETPEEPLVTTTLRIPDSLDARIAVLAGKERKSKAQWMREALELVAQRAEGRAQ